MKSPKTKDLYVRFNAVSGKWETGYLAGDAKSGGISWFMLSQHATEESAQMRIRKMSQENQGIFLQARRCVF